METVYLILITTVIVLVSFILLGVRVLFVKNGKFPDTHIGDNKAIKKHGVSCATSQAKRTESDENSIKESVGRVIREL